MISTYLRRPQRLKTPRPARRRQHMPATVILRAADPTAGRIARRDLVYETTSTANEIPIWVYIFVVSIVVVVLVLVALLCYRWVRRAPSGPRRYVRAAESPPAQHETRQLPAPPTRLASKPPPDPELGGYYAPAVPATARQPKGKRAVKAVKVVKVVKRDVGGPREQNAKETGEREPRTRRCRFR